MADYLEQIPGHIRRWIEIYLSQNPTEAAHLAGVLQADFGLIDSRQITTPISTDLFTLGREVDAVAAVGSFSFTENPVDGDTLPSINGVSDIVFKDAPAAWPEVQIEADLETTLTTLASDITANIATPGYEALADLEYSSNATQLSFAAAAPGVAGNLIPLGEATANIVPSGPALTGGQEITYDDLTTSVSEMARVGMALCLGNLPAAAIQSTDLVPIRQIDAFVTASSGGGQYSYRGESNGYPQYNKLLQPDDANNFAVAVINDGGLFWMITDAAGVAYYKSVDTADQYPDVFNVLWEAGSGAGLPDVAATPVIRTVTKAELIA